MPQNTNQDCCFHRETSNHLLPPQPVFTHWCTSFEALEYYSGNYEFIAENFQEFSDTDDAAFVGLVRGTVNGVNVKKKCCTHRIKLRIFDSGHYKSGSIRNITARHGVFVENVHE
jgi:hypothetical protein